MKRYLLQLVACSMLVAAHGFASEPAAPPSPSVSSENAVFSVAPDEKKRENVFIGHYGEILRLYPDWTAEAALRGSMEVVYMREKTLPAPSKRSTSVELKGGGATVTFHESPIQIKPEEFIPENFARLRLMQLMVIPIDVPGGFRTLVKLREAKLLELAATGNPFKLQQAGDYPWPAESFWVSISTPNRIFQLYTQSDKNFFIFTSGASPFDEKLDDPVLGSATEKLANSLSTYLSGFRRQIAADRDFVPNLSIALLPGAVVLALALLLSFLPKRGSLLVRIRLVGRTTFGYAVVAHLLAGPALFASWRMGQGRAINEASILVCAAILAPLISKFISGQLGGRRPWRVFGWSAIFNILPVLFGLAGLEDFVAGTATITGYHNFWMMSLTLSVLALLNGVALGLTHRMENGNPTASAS